MEQNNDIATNTVKPNFCNTITPLSKHLAMILFIILPFIGSYIGYQYSLSTISIVEKPIFYQEVTKEIPVYVSSKEHTAISYPAGGETIDLRETLPIKYVVDDYIKSTASGKNVLTQFYLLNEKDFVIGYLGDWDAKANEFSFEPNLFTVSAGLDTLSSTTKPGTYRILMVARYSLYPDYNPECSHECKHPPFDIIDDPNLQFKNGIFFYNNEIDDMEETILSAVASKQFFLTE